MATQIQPTTECICKGGEPDYKLAFIKNYAELLSLPLLGQSVVCFVCRTAHIKE